jgi:hypothetical protein
MFVDAWKFMLNCNHIFRVFSAPHTGCIFWCIFYCKFSLDFYCIFFQKMTVSSLRDWLWVLAGSTSKHFSNYWSMFAIEMWSSCQNFSSKFPGIKKILKNFKSHFWKNTDGAYGPLRDWLWLANYWSIFAIEMWSSCQNFSSKVLRFQW